MKKTILTILLAVALLSQSFPAFSASSFNSNVKAAKVSTATTNFNTNLSSADNTVQRALDTLDDAASGAPTSATYITQTPNASLSAEQALSSLATGYVKNTTGTGVLSVQAVPIPVADGGTATSTAFTTGSVVFAGASGVYSQDNANLFWDDTNNFLEIGGLAASGLLPANVRLSVNSSDTYTQIQAVTASNSDIYSVFALYRARGNISSPTTVQNGDNIGEFGFKSYDGSATLSSANIVGFVDGPTASLQVPTGFKFHTSETYDPGRLNRLQISANGNIIINAPGGNCDLRVAGDTDANLFFTDASTDRVGIGTATPASKLDVSGSFQADSITNDTGLAAGVYTPTRSAEANMDANVTMTQAQYMRVGNTVTVSGRFTADPTLAATATSFEITLPVASNIGAVEDAAGVAFCGLIAGMGAEVIGVVANDTAKIQWVSGDITSKVWSFTFSYRVI